MSSSARGEGKGRCRLFPGGVNAKEAVRKVSEQVFRQKGGGKWIDQKEILQI